MKSAAYPCVDSQGPVDVLGEYWGTLHWIQCPGARMQGIHYQHSKFLHTKANT